MSYQQVLSLLTVARWYFPPVCVTKLLLTSECRLENVPNPVSSADKPKGRYIACCVVGRKAPDEAFTESGQIAMFPIMAL